MLLFKPPAFGHIHDDAVNNRRLTIAGWRSIDFYPHFILPGIDPAFPIPIGERGDAVLGGVVKVFPISFVYELLQRKNAAHQYLLANAKDLLAPWADVCEFPAPILNDSVFENNSRQLIQQLQISPLTQPYGVAHA